MAVGWNLIWLMRASPSIDTTECVSIDCCLRPSIDSHGRWSTSGLCHFISKITSFLQINPKSENILNILQNNYNVFKNTYIPWLKMGKIHGISAYKIKPPAKANIHPTFHVSQLKLARGCSVSLIAQ